MRCICYSNFLMEDNNSILNYTQWNLPEGTKARFGKGNINDMKCSADGNLLAVATSIGVWLYDLTTGEERNLFIGHSSEVFSISFNSDGTILASGGRYYDYTIRLWDVKTGNNINRFSIPRDDTNSLSFSPDNRILASSVGAEIWLWDVETGEHINTLIGHTGRVSDVLFSPDKRLLVSGSVDGTLRLWNNASGENVKVLTGHTGWVSSTSFSSDSCLLASGSHDNTVRIWDVKNGKNIGTLVGHTEPVTSVSFSNDNRLLSSGSYDNTVRIWDVKNGKNTVTLVGHTDLINGVSFSRDDSCLVSASRREIRIWDMGNGKHIKTLTGHLQDINSISFSGDDSVLASSVQGTIYLWDFKTGRNIKILTGNKKQVFSNVLLSSDGCLLVSSSRGQICFWDVESGRKTKTLFDHEVPIESFSFSPNNRFLACTSHDNTLRLWDVENGELIKTLIGDSNHVFSNSFFVDNKCLLASASQRDVRLWNVETGEYIEVLTGYTEDIERVWLGEGSRYVIALKTSYGSKLELWDVIDRKYIVTLVGDTNHVFHNVSFNGNNNTLASADSNNKLRIWDMKTGELIKTLTGHTREIESIAFSSDGLTLASGSKDGTVLVWDVENYIDSSFFNEEVPILTEKSTPYQNRSSQLQRYCKEREIETLYHFTRIENLRSILQEGLIGRSILHSRESQFLWNDDDRADGCSKANCLSISFPNYQMFYSIRERKKSEGVNDSHWVVLLLDAKLLWELDCAFCQRNAASNAVSTIPLDERKKPTALMVMFGDFYSIKRQDLQIPKNYPTHPQAEVLVFDQIPAEYINAIHFRDATILEEWRSNYTGTFSDKFFVNRDYFNARSDYEVWKSENFDSDGIPLTDAHIDSNLELSDIDDDIPF